MRAEAKGAKIENSEKHKWAVSPTKSTTLPLYFRFPLAGTNERLWHTVGHQPPAKHATNTPPLLAIL